MQPTPSRRAFTLIELLVVIAIIAIFAGLLLPSLSGAKDRAKRAYCVNNLRQIGIAVRLYADDHENTLPFANPAAPMTNYWCDLRNALANYVGSSAPSITGGGLFACPADTFYYEREPGNIRVSESAHSQARFRYSSYSFNVGN